MHQLYRHFDKDGKLLYIGISISAMTRLSQHKSVSPWFDQIANVTIENHESRKAVLKAERESIFSEEPIHNKQYVRKPTCSPEPETAQEKSNLVLVKRIVDFQPVYSLHDAAGVLNIGVAALKRLVEQGAIGAMKIPHGTTFRWRLTGWQLIEYLEFMQEKYKA